MGKILIGIPVLYGAAHCKEAIDSVIYKVYGEFIIGNDTEIYIYIE